MNDRVGVTDVRSKVQLGRLRVALTGAKRPARFDRVAMRAASSLQTSFATNGHGCLSAASEA